MHEGLERGGYGTLVSCLVQTQGGEFAPGVTSDIDYATFNKDLGLTIRLSA